MGKMIDISGQRFGKLTVVSCAGKLDGKLYYWNCKCDCGNEKTVSGTALRTGRTQSCGCGKSKGLVEYNQKKSEEAKIPLGTRFGKLVVIEDIGFRQQVEGHNRRWYKCRCDCGREKEIMGNFLKQGQTISCGHCVSSVGELKIENILLEASIPYAKEFTIPQFKEEVNRNLRFDFVLYADDGTIKRCIEFDGRQHFNGPDTNYWGHSNDTLETIQERDSLKNKWCIAHNIPLVRIPYWVEPTLEIIIGDTYIIRGNEL